MLPTLHRPHTLERPLDLFRRDFDSLRTDMARFFTNWLPSEFVDEDVVGAYPMDVREENGKLIVDAELPGFAKSEIKVSVENGVLSISAERKQEKNKNGKQHLHERRYTKVERQVALPALVDDTTTSAKFDNGVLHLELSKVPGPKAKVITIA